MPFVSPYLAIWESDYNFFCVCVLSCWNRKREGEKGEISRAGRLHTAQTNTSHALLTWAHALKGVGTSNARTGIGRGLWAQRTPRETQTLNSHLMIILKMQRRPMQEPSLASHLRRVCCPSHRATGWVKTPPNIPTAAGSRCPCIWKPYWRSSPSRDSNYINGNSSNKKKPRIGWGVHTFTAETNSPRSLRQKKVIMNWLHAVRKNKDWKLVATGSVEFLIMSKMSCL